MIYGRGHRAQFNISIIFANYLKILTACLFLFSAHPALRTCQEIINLPLKTSVAVFVYYPPGFVMTVEGDDKMTEDLKKFEAVFADWTGREFRVATIELRIEDEKDALEIAQDIALLEGLS